MRTSSTMTGWWRCQEPWWFGWAVVALVCTPALIGVVGLIADFALGSRVFGSNPIKAVEHYFGEWTLRFLLATLCITPLRRMLGWNWLFRHRRTLGLTAFTYLMLHWLCYAVLDVQFDWQELLTDLAKRPYIMIGMGALVCMLPLALTSTRRMMQRLGRNWCRLHRLIYPIAIAGVTHFWLSVKQDITEPAIYAAILASLLGYRLWHTLRARAEVRLRQRATGATGDCA